jgi:phage FluMu protein Com
MELARGAVYSETCPKCKAINYYDADHFSESDVDAIRCFRCDQVFLTEGVDWTTPEDANEVDGRAEI